MDTSKCGTWFPTNTLHEKRDLVPKICIMWDLVPKRSIEKWDLVPESHIESWDLVPKSSIVRWDMVPNGCMKKWDLVPNGFVYIIKEKVKYNRNLAANRNTGFVDQKY